MISIVIPTLNEEKYIEKLLTCLKNQTYKYFEIIIIDANSQDKTKDIIRLYNNFLKIKIINSEKRNVSFQRNLGLKNSKNESVLFLDADTTFDNDFLENALKEIKENDIKIAGCLLYPDSKDNIYNLFFSLFRIYINLLHSYIGFNGCCIFTLKSIHNKINGFDENIKVGEDYDYTKRLKKLSKLSLLKTVKIKTSVRRFEKYGRLRTGIKYLLIGLYILLFGNITKDTFKYKFNEK